MEPKSLRRGRCDTVLVFQGVAESRTKYTGSVASRVARRKPCHAVRGPSSAPLVTALAERKPPYTQAGARGKRMLGVCCLTVRTQTMQD